VSMALCAEVQKDPELTPEQEDLRELLAQLIGELEQPYATVVGLVEVEGASFAETALAMGLGSASVRLLYAEGRRRLRSVVLAHSEAGDLR
jgi:DNA-directed RNA polymerase specialized sigma24 family protein